MIGDLFNLIYNGIDSFLAPLVQILQQLSPNHYVFYLTLIISTAYVLLANLIIRAVTDQNERRALENGISGLNRRIKELKGARYVKENLRLFRMNQEELRQIIRERKEKRKIIAEERKKLRPLKYRFLWKFRIKPMFYYLFPLIFLLRWLRLKFYGVTFISWPALSIYIGVLEVSILCIIAFNLVIRKGIRWV